MDILFVVIQIFGHSLVHNILALETRHARYKTMTTMVQGSHVSTHQVSLPFGTFCFFLLGKLVVANLGRKVHESPFNT